MKKSVDKVRLCGTLAPSLEGASDLTGYSADFYAKNKNRYAFYNAEQRDRLRLELVEAYGGKCISCGFNNPLALIIDHIDDDAYVEKELYGLNARGGHKHYWRLKAAGWPKDRFQLLCHNCNSIKEHNRRRDAMVARVGPKEQVFAKPKRAGEGPRKSNKSGIKGVFWNTQKQRWQAKITVSGVDMHLGFFIDKIDAINACIEGTKQARGDYAYIPTEAEIAEATKIDPTLTPDNLGL